METIEETIEETVEEVTPSYVVLDAIATIANGREYFDRKEIDAFLVQLNEKGIDHPELTDKMIARCEKRVYVSGQFVMDVMLDIRNIIAPYPKLNDIALEG